MVMFLAYSQIAIVYFLAALFISAAFNDDLYYSIKWDWAGRALVALASLHIAMVIFQTRDQVNLLSVELASQFEAIAAQNNKEGGE